MANPNSMSNRIPPHDEEAEIAVLGSMLLDNEQIVLVEPMLSRGDFYSAAHQEIYQTILDIHGEIGAVDLTLLRSELGDLLVKVGGVDYLMKIAESVMSAGNAEHYAGIVCEKARLRRVITTGNAMVSKAYDDDGTGVGEFLPGHVKALSDTMVKRDTGVVSLGHVAVQVAKTFDEKVDTGIMCGFPKLDDTLMGFRPTLIIIAGLASAGKSAFTKTICLNMARNGHRILWFSFEDNEYNLTRDFYSIIAGVNTYNVYRPSRMDEDDWKKVSVAMGEMAKLPIFFCTDHELTAQGIGAHVAREMAKEPVSMVVVDYLQLITRPNRQQRDEEVGVVAKELLALTNNFNVPVVALSQLNREYGKRKDKRPQLGELRESGSLEQAARVVLLMHRESYFSDDQEYQQKLRYGEMLDPCEIKIAKNTVGARQVTHTLYFEQPTLRFHNNDRVEDEVETPF